MFAASKSGRAVSGATTDPYFPYVPLLLETGASSTRSTTVTDGAATPNTVTRNGTPSTGWTSPYQTTGYWSGYFNGSTDYLSIASNTALNLSSGNFTIEAFVYWSGSNANSTIIVKDSVFGTSYPSYQMSLNGSGFVACYVGSGNGQSSLQTITSGTALTLNAWNHLAFVKNSTNLSLYQNGISVASVTQTATITDGGKAVLVGYNSGQPSSHYFSGYISNVRIVKGVAVYTGAFTVPTAPLAATQSSGTNISAITGTATSLLTCQSNRFIDNSTNAFAITTAGTPQTTPYYYPSGFTAPTASPGAGLFNGTGDYLSIPTATPLVLAGGSWTIEAWINPTGNYSDYRIIVNKRSGTSPASYDFYLNTGTGYLAFYNSTAYTSTSAPIANTWNHVAAVYDGTNINLYLNGTRVLQSASGNPDNGGNVFVGCDNNGVSGYFPGYISNVRIVKGTAVYTGAFTPPSNFVTQTGGTYPSTTNVNTSIPSANTSLLLNLADSNYTSATNGVQNNTFIDSSNYAFPITRNGTPTQGAFTPYQPSGYWSGYFDGSNSNYLSLTNSSALQLTNATAFTIECWVYLFSTTGYPQLINNYNPNSPYQGYALRATSPTSNTFEFWDGTSWTQSGAVQLNVWTHVAVSYEGSGSTRRIFINGVLQGSAGTVSSSINYTTGTVALGSGGGFSTCNGYISNFRIVKGTAVYTSTFTPPTTPLTATQSANVNGNPSAAITGTATSLLTLQSNRFIDNSTNAFAITVNGTPKVQAFQPFSPAASYSAATYGGSGYFNGSTDYLNLGGQSAFAFGTSNFTIEFWVFVPAVPSTAYIQFDFRPTTTNGAYPYVYLNPDMLLRYYVSSLDRITATTAIVLNTWNHVAISRSASVTKMFLNGVQQGSNYSDTNSYLVGTNRPAIASSGYTLGQYPLNGYISNFRIVNGTAIYTAAFTPPTLPVTAVSGTSLLTNFTNAGIYDAAWQNNVTTVGDAQTSISQYKWSPTSMRFDGTGDYLTMPTNPVFALGTGDFTIEFWVYFSSITGGSFLLDFRPSGTAVGIYPTIYVPNLTTTIAFYTNGADRIVSSSGSISTGSWIYVAVTKASGSTKMYLNGSQVGSTYTDANSYLAGASRPVIGASGVDFSAPLNGYLQDLRITKGVARTVTTPTAAFPTR